MHSGTITLDRDGRLDGMTTGTVIVAPGVRADIAGMVNGSVIVGKDAHVTVSGMVNGGIVNHGGHLVVTGMVAG